MQSATILQIHFLSASRVSRYLLTILYDIITFGTQYMKKIIFFLTIIILILIVARLIGFRRIQRIPRKPFFSRIPTQTPLKSSPNIINETPANIGYTIYTVSITDEQGVSHKIVTNIWYPTNTAPSSFTYTTVKNQLRKGVIESALAKNAPVKKANAPYPLILFLHGDLTCGTQSLFLTEYIAKKGYIVAAPDFLDNVTICRSADGEKSARALDILRELRTIKNADSNNVLSMLSVNQRVPGASRIIDELIKFNRTQGHILFNAIDENTIGLIGHSYGGISILGLIGAYPNNQYYDKRIKATVILSGGVFPFQDNLSNITLPLMVMQGDDKDDLDLVANIPRKKVYDDARGPKFFLKLLGGDHGSFYNGVCASYTSTNACQQSNGFAQVINTYSVAFFNLYLKNDTTEQATLQQSNALLKMYEKNF